MQQCDQCRGVLTHRSAQAGAVAGEPTGQGSSRVLLKLMLSLKTILEYAVVVSLESYVKETQCFLDLIKCQPDFEILSIRKYWQREAADIKGGVSCYAQMNTAAGPALFRIIFATPALAALSARRHKDIAARLATSPDLQFKEGIRVSEREQRLMHEKVVFPAGIEKIGTPAFHGQSMSHKEFNIKFNTVANSAATVANGSSVADEHTGGACSSTAMLIAIAAYASFVVGVAITKRSNKALFTQTSA